MNKIKSISIYKPQETSTFAIGEKLTIGKKETEHVVETISVNHFNTVEVKFSTGMILVFKGFPIVYEI